MFIFHLPHVTGSSNWVVKEKSSPSSYSVTFFAVIRIDKA